MVGEAHHIVTGGAVAGGDMYGQYPVIGSNQANNTGAGRLIPTTSVEQYAGTLAKWFGLTDSQVKQVFPNFTTSAASPYRVFMGWAAMVVKKAARLPPRGSLPSR